MTARLRLVPRPEGFPPGGAGSIKIVLADDHATVRRNLRLLLDGEDGMDVIAEAGDITTVMHDVPLHSPHILILDLRLPSQSSIETIRTLRDRHPATAIVMLTMVESPAFAQRALDAGASGFVLKDKADEELATAIRRAAEGQEFVSPRLAAALAAVRGAVTSDGLSAREIEVLRLTALGHTSIEIAQRLNLSRRTVETHRARIHGKLGLATRAQLVRYALGRHLINN
jgi:two-component system response regulator NreC